MWLHYRGEHVREMGSSHFRITTPVKAKVGVAGVSMYISGEGRGPKTTLKRQNLQVFDVVMLKFLV